MHLKSLEISGFKSFAKKGVFDFNSPVSAIVGPNGSGKSNVAEAIRFVLGEQSMKSMRGKRGEDLIWNGSQSVGRSNYASVSITFDNTGKEFDIDFDEVVIKRKVFRDGANQYFINNSQVRLRDIIELLSKVHIGATGHHIISQGEADRILNANTKERRTMIEEALGLKIYQWKIDESSKKLAKTEENLKQIVSLRREIAPHIRFLKKQVDKIEKAKEMREDLKGFYAEYLKREQVYIAGTKARLAQEKSSPEHELKTLESELDKARASLSEQEMEDPQKGELARLEIDISDTRKQKDELSRGLGRIEGMIEFEERRIRKVRDGQKKAEFVAYKEVKWFTDNLEEYIEEASRKETIEGIKVIFEKVREVLGDFIARIHNTGEKDEFVNTEELEKMKTEKEETSKKLGALLQKEKELQQTYERLKSEIEKEKDSSRELERAVFEMMAKKSELSATISRIRNEEQRIEKEEAAFKEEIKEGIALIGRDVTLYENFAVDTIEVMTEDREVQEKRRKEIEKIKIRLEEHGLAGSHETIKEYEDVTERDRFLEREILDLEKSAESLKTLIAELIEKLNTDFKEGVKKINKQFQDFFALMFGGGGASLVVVAQKKKKRLDTDVTLGDEVPDDEETEEGIDISVSLPRKKIKSLQMLSGGERALTSIALIFAVSQVNPPPFLVLDETDAALDEANSRKYGDMIENLSKHSQLIVVTHNRETMSRANILYGITMSTDAVSKLLSIKFDEAESYAK
jgi:chromosome segregation protein